MRNRKTWGTFAAIALICGVVFLTSASIVRAEDLVISAKVDRVVSKVGKNGEMTTTVFIEEQRTLNGIEYSARAPVFASGSAKSTEVSQIKEGDTIKAIVSKRSSRGGDTVYTLLKLIP